MLEGYDGNKTNAAINLRDISKKQGLSPAFGQEKECYGNGGGKNNCC